MKKSKNSAPPKFAVGKTTKIEVNIVDNALSAYLNPDGENGVRGYAKVFDFQGGGFGARPDCEVNISDALDFFRSAGAQSVIITFIGSNFSGQGPIGFEIETDGHTIASVSDNLLPYESRQWAYELTL